MEANLVIFTDKVPILVRLIIQINYLMNLIITEWKESKCFWNGIFEENRIEKKYKIMTFLINSWIFHEFFMAKGGSGSFRNSYEWYTETLFLWIINFLQQIIVHTHNVIIQNWNTYSIEQNWDVLNSKVLNKLKWWLDLRSLFEKGWDGAHYQQIWNSKGEYSHLR